MSSLQASNGESEETSFSSNLSKELVCNVSSTSTTSYSAVAQFNLNSSLSQISYNNHNSPTKHYYSVIPSNPLDHSQGKYATDLQKIIHDQNEMIKNLNLTIQNLILKIDELDKKLNHDDADTLPTQRQNPTYPNGNEKSQKSAANSFRKDKGNIDLHIATINKEANSYIK
ncbi:hypothetical protein GJ496_009067 [Pomphorhynchus laevis]|nr:hypothetical protein GJ496_009067 [Pomphorhynchus laevis]